LEAGIPHFNLDRLTSNTMASHRLIQHIGKKYGLRVSEGLYDRLNTYYFVEGHALNDKKRLAGVAAEEIARLLATGDLSDDAVAPLTEAEIRYFLEGIEGQREIKEALLTLREIGVHGIPKFIIEGRTVVDGAARSDHFVQIFRGIEQRGEVAGGPVFSDILGISDEVVRRGSHTVPSERLVA